MDVFDSTMVLKSPLPLVHRERGENTDDAQGNMAEHKASSLSPNTLLDV
jgi:hypothetical protein